jgi:hypothetical protein
VADNGFYQPSRDGEVGPVQGLTDAHFRRHDRPQLIQMRSAMTSEKICDRCRELYRTYKNINEDPSATSTEVYSAQAAVWQDLQAHLEETKHDLQSVIGDWSGLTTNERTA